MTHSSTVADINPLGQNLREDADPDRQEPTLPKIDGMQFVDIAGIELFKNREQVDLWRYRLGQ